MPRPAETILILGGTTEAAALAAMLVHKHPQLRVITSLAGRTKEPQPVAGEVRTGGFGGAEGLAAYIKQNAVGLLIDLTHPFALQISENALQASKLSGVELRSWQRAPWAPEPGDNWTIVKTASEAACFIPVNARALLAIGSQRIGEFKERSDVHFVVRTVDEPADPLPLPRYEVLTGKPGNEKQEAILLREKAVTCIICRNSGGTASYGKIAAARSLGIPVIMIVRKSGALKPINFDAFKSEIMLQLASGAN